VLSKHGKKSLKYHNFDRIFTFYGALVPTPFTDLGKIWQETVDLWSTLTHHISFESIPGIKSHNFGQFFKFGELLYQAPPWMMAKFGMLE